MAYKGKVEILEDKTKVELGYSSTDLSFGSHKRVYVKCMVCEEVFLREFKALNNLHKCPKYKCIDGIDYKWCNSCNIYKPFKSFLTPSRSMRRFQERWFTPSRG